MIQISLKNNCLLVAIVLMLSAISSSTYAQDVPLSIHEQASDTQITLTLPRGIAAKTFSLKNPPRLVVDVPNAGKKPTINWPSNYQGTLINKIRSGQYNANTGRIVLELTKDFKFASQQHGTELKLLVTPYGKQQATSNQPSWQQQSTPPKPKKKTIVLDAGHGGQDPGARGNNGTKEKDLVLSFAKELKKTLDDTGKYRVLLTRDGDYYIALRDRIAFARKENADIFISLHADSGSSTARGLSVYTLSETASDKEAAALAEKENKSDIIAGVNLGAHDKEVANILISLAQRETNNQSTILADTLVSSLQNQDMSLLNRPHRFAGFAVLKAPDIPSVLIEIGFISNSEEEKVLNKPAYRSKLAKGLTKALQHYFDTTSHAFE